MMREINITPIETNYNGYKFRSRTEARWAAFFDIIGLKWEYEKEGFKFNDGTMYVPDFWLPDVNMWAEVKPDEFTDEEMIKAANLVRATHHDCIFLIGNPDKKSYNFIFIKDDKIDKNDCIISMFHNYPIEEKRFFTATGGFEFDGHDFDDVKMAVDKVKTIRFYK